jgi:colanic acid/amylovoran biosynthesis glycosyltransferase
MPRIGIIASTFPRPVDAYLLRELAALVEHGIDLRIYSLRSPGNAPCPHGARALIDATTYAPARTAPALRAAHRELLKTRPRRYASTLTTLVRDHARSPRLLAKVVATWPQTVYFAHAAVQDGLQHIHANWATYPAASAMAISSLTGLPWSFSGHASDIFLEATGLARKIRAARFVTTCTADSRRYLLDIAGQIDPDRVHTVYHGTDLGAFQLRRAEPSELHIIAVGTLRECKGFDTLLHSLAALRAGDTPARLTIVGDGEDRASLTRLAADLGLAPHVTFTGYVPHEDLAELYAQASVLVLPARAATHFGIPNVIVEAQAASLPVVCSPLPALSELLEDGVSAVYVPQDDAPRLAVALRALFEEPARRRRLASEGLRRVTARFDITETSKTWVRLLTGIDPTPVRQVAAG